MSLQKSNRPYLFGIFFVSLATLHFELLLIRLFSLKFFFHYVHIILNLTMLGAGASASLLAILKRRIKMPASRALSIAAFLFFLSLFTFYIYFNNARIPMANSPAAGTRSTLLNWAALYGITTLPFFCSGFIITYIFQHVSSPRSYFKFYFADLLGAGLGCLIMFFSITYFSSHTSMILIFTEIFAALLIFLYCDKSKPKIFFMAAIPLLLIMILLFNPTPFSQTRHLAQKDRRYNPQEIIYRHWTPLGRVDVERTHPVIPLRFSEKDRKPLQGRHFYFDGVTPARQLLLQKGSEDWNLLPGALYSLAFLLKPESPEVCIIGIGGGIETLAGIHAGAERVVGVDINPVIHKALTGKLKIGDDTEAYLSTFYAQDKTKVDFVNQDGRSYIASTKDRFDAIQLTGVASFTALVGGAYNLAENYLYTKQAFGDYIRHLKKNGILIISLPGLDPPRESMKIFVTLLEVLAEMGYKNPKDHIMIVKERMYESIIAKRDAAFSLKEKKVFYDWANKYQYDIRFCNGLALPQQSHFTELSSLQNSRGHYRAFAKGWLDLTKKDFLRNDYFYSVDPPTDDNPFFYQYYKGVNSFTFIPSPETPSAILLSHSAFSFSLIGALAFILAPLAAFSIGKHKKINLPFRHLISIIWYFAVLGFAFIVLELLLISNLQKALGSPVYAISLILPILLTAAGFGSVMASKLSRLYLWRNILKIAGLLIFFFTVFSALVLPPVINYIMTLSFLWRILFSALYTGLPGLILGIFFPIGLLQLSRLDQRLIAWAWAINFSFAVLGASLAPHLFSNLGFKICFILCGILYLTAGNNFSRVVQKKTITK